MRVVADTNTVVSGLGWGGAPGQIMNAVLEGRLSLVTSPALLAELERVLAYPKLAKVFDDPDRLVALMATIAEVVEPTITLAVVDDEPDNRVLEAAVAGEVDAIITGDKALRAVETYSGIRLVTAQEFMASWA